VSDDEDDANDAEGIKEAAKRGGELNDAFEGASLPNDAAPTMLQLVTAPVRQQLSGRSDVAARKAVSGRRYVRKPRQPHPECAVPRKTTQRQHSETAARATASAAQGAALSAWQAQGHADDDAHTQSSGLERPDSAADLVLEAAISEPQQKSDGEPSPDPSVRATSPIRVTGDAGQFDDLIVKSKVLGFDLLFGDEADEYAATTPAERASFTPRSVQALSSVREPLCVLSVDDPIDATGDGNVSESGGATVVGVATPAMQAIVAAATPTPPNMERELLLFGEDAISIANPIAPTPSGLDSEATPPSSAFKGDEKMQADTVDRLAKECINSMPLEWKQLLFTFGSRASLPVEKRVKMLLRRLRKTNSVGICRNMLRAIKHLKRYLQANGLNITDLSADVLIDSLEEYDDSALLRAKDRKAQRAAVGKAARRNDRGGATATYPVFLGYSSMRNRCGLPLELTDVVKEVAKAGPGMPAIQPMMGFEDVRYRRDVPPCQFSHVSSVTDDTWQ